MNKTQPKGSSPETVLLSFLGHSLTLVFPLSRVFHSMGRCRPSPPVGMRPPSHSGIVPCSVDLINIWERRGCGTINYLGLRDVVPEGP